MNTEPELKFRVAKGKLRAVAEMQIEGVRPGARTSRKLVSTYFDTPKHKFRRHGLTLRVRQAGDDFQQTVKSSAVGGFTRGEWEAELPDATPSLRELDRTPLAELATRKLKRKLRPVFRTSVNRIACPLRVGTSDIELAVDRGTLVAGRKTRPIGEFELELKKGRTADLFRLARQFERQIGAELDLRSKSERGYQLASGDQQIAVSAEAIELSDRMTAAEAFGVIAFSTLRHFSSNAEAVRELDAEAVHQMRVGLRRLRAAISLFGAVLPSASTESIKAELKWLTGELGPAREIDVFFNDRIKPLQHSDDVPSRGVRAIEKQFSGQRKAAFQRARDALATPRYRKLPIDILEWLESRKQSPAGKGDELGKWAAQMLGHRIRKVRKGARDLTGLSAVQRHRLRIRIKKIRYGVEFFRSLYPDGAQHDLAQLSDQLKQGQEALGALNDFVAHRKLAAQAALDAPGQDRRARAFAAGLLVGEERQASKKLLRVASLAISNLKPSSVQLG
jgi:triphosphatase